MASWFLLHGNKSRVGYPLLIFDEVLRRTSNEKVNTRVFGFVGYLYAYDYDA